jgi:hypothetical protein
VPAAAAAAGTAALVGPARHNTRSTLFSGT